jgi:hypothetical protein
MEARFIIFCGKTYKIWIGPDFFSPLNSPIIIIGAEHFLIVIVLTCIQTVEILKVIHFERLKQYI